MDPHRNSPDNIADVALPNQNPAEASANPSNHGNVLPRSGRPDDHDDNATTAPSVFAAATTNDSISSPLSNHNRLGESTTSTNTAPARSPVAHNNNNNNNSSGSSVNARRASQHWRSASPSAGGGGATTASATHRLRVEGRTADGAPIVVDAMTGTPVVGFTAHSSTVRSIVGSSSVANSRANTRAGAESNTSSVNNRASPIHDQYNSPSSMGGGPLSTTNSKANRGRAVTNPCAVSSTRATTATAVGVDDEGVEMESVEVEGDEEDGDKDCEEEEDGGAQVWEGKVGGAGHSHEKRRLLDPLNRHYTSAPSGFVMFLMMFACTLTVMGTAGSQYFGNIYTLNWGPVPTVSGAAREIHVIRATIHLYLFQARYVTRDDNEPIRTSRYTNEIYDGYHGPRETGSWQGQNIKFIMPDGTNSVADYLARNEVTEEYLFNGDSFVALGECKTLNSRIHAAFAFAILSSIATFFAGSFAFIRICDRTAATKFSVVLSCFLSLTFLTVAAALSTSVYDSDYCNGLPPLKHQEFHINFGLGMLYASMGISLISLIWACMTR